MCATCPLAQDCPIEEWPDAPEPEPRPVVDQRIRRDRDLDRTRGPLMPQIRGRADAVWITAESLGDEDPALAAHPDLPAVFVFDEGLLARLRLSPARLAFLAETLADLATRRPVEVWRGDPVSVLAGRAVAATFAPVPGWRARSARIQPVDVRPWPWLVEPHAGPITSFTAWSRSSRR
jgi:deoxyribodipyrimidine photo-lyase